MVDFNSDIPKGTPRLDSKYWETFNNKTNKTDSKNFPLSELNTYSALEDMKNSIFNDTKK